MQGDHGAKIAVAVTKVAEKVESNVRKVVAASATQQGQQQGGPAVVPGSLTIKQVRRPSGKLHSAKNVAPPAAQYQQPHIAVGVAAPGETKQSKWEDAPAAATAKATKGNMMIDTGAAVTLVTRAWAEAHGLKISSPPGISINGADGQAVEVVGTTAMTL